MWLDRAIAFVIHHLKMARRNNLIPVRTDDAEMAYVDERVERAGTSRSAFIRWLIREEKRRDLKRSRRSSISEAA
jgi:metal-responsive CopG/Arc/MetJ family transcriptional regulator